MPTQKKYHAVSLFSGGLDSIVATKTIMNQGLSVLCLHFYSPFFGFPHKIKEWQQSYGFTIKAIDISEDYVRLLTKPNNGFGRYLNPCIDCKIMMISKAKIIMQELGAEFIISGEVIGQRPMSQRSDTLQLIRRDADVADVLLRPLCVQSYPPIAAERSGLVKRELLHQFVGRGRKNQIKLAKSFGFTKIPNAAGGCLLTEQENSQRYRLILEQRAKPTANDFFLANLGRQFWFNINSKIFDFAPKIDPKNEPHEGQNGEQIDGQVEEQVATPELAQNISSELAQKISSEPVQKHETSEPKLHSFEVNAKDYTDNAHLPKVQNPLWFCVGRNQSDNLAILDIAGENDLIFKVVGFPGPLNICRQVVENAEYAEPDLQALAAFSLLFSPKASEWAKANNAPVAIRILTGAEAKKARLESPHIEGGRELMVTLPQDLA